jgi:DNA end-binding protein Ku
MGDPAWAAKARFRESSAAELGRSGDYPQHGHGRHRHGRADEPRAYHSPGALGEGSDGTLLRYPYEVRDEKEYFDEIQDVKVTKDMLDLAKHIVSQKTADFEPEKFEDHYEEALTELINAKRNGKTIAAKPRPRDENVVDLMDALRRSIGGTEPARASKSSKKPRKGASDQKEMLMPIEGKKVAKGAAAKKPASKSQRKSA